MYKLYIYLYFYLADTFVKSKVQWDKYNITNISAVEELIRHKCSWAHLPMNTQVQT